MNFMFLWQEQYHTRLLRSLVRCCSCHSNIKFISSRHHVISSIYYIYMSVENTPLVKFIRNHIQDLSGVFSTSSLVRIFMPLEISRLSLRLYLNLLVYDQNIFGSSLKVFGHLRQSSVIFGNFQKMFGNVCATFRQILENFRRFYDVIALRSHCSARMRSFVV